MARVNELRIGNKFDYHGQTVWVMKVARTWAEFGYFTDSVGFERAFDDEDFPRPIPLTPEILTQWCGFRKDATFRNPYYSPDGEMRILFQDEKYPLAKFKNGQRVVRFLHELQNLIFFLREKELEIKIPAKA